MDPEFRVQNLQVEFRAQNLKEYEPCEYSYRGCIQDQTKHWEKITILRKKSLKGFVKH